MGGRSEWSEWALAFVVSALINVLMVPLVVGLLAAIQIYQPAPRTASEHEPVAVIHPDMLQPEVEPAVEDKPRPFAHSSDDQESGKTERARYVGERDTLAAADEAPTEDTHLVPTQDGREPRAEGEVETVSRDYQDGTLEHQNDGMPGETASPSMPAEPAEEAKSEPWAEEVPEYVQEAPKRDRLAQGPNPVDRAMPPEAAKEGDQVREGGAQPQPKEAVETPPKPKPKVAGGGEPGFRGNQVKTRLRGSISRRGKSSLDVENNATGRYQAVLNRAVEREWQRNCVRYRDFITPGFLTVRFLVEADGDVRSIQFVEVVEAGEIQKGFTLNSIRGAPIPPMPADLKRDLRGDPLELIYNFYF